MFFNDEERFRNSKFLEYFFLRNWLGVWGGWVVYFVRDDVV